MTKIVLHTHVASEGHTLDKIVYYWEDTVNLATITPKHFTVCGTSYSWRRSCQGVSEVLSSPSGYRTSEATPFTATVSDVIVDKLAHTLTLLVHNFAPKFYYVSQLSVVCCSTPALSFETSCRIQDDMTFEMSHPLVHVTIDEVTRFQLRTQAKLDGGFDELKYYFFQPEHTKSTPLPLVLANHGAGDQMTLLSNRVVLYWAQEEFQSHYPAYIIAPVYPQSTDEETYLPRQDEVVNRSVALIRTMVDEGLVDPTRIYVTGKSLGGGNTVKLASRYLDFFAAAMPICCNNPMGPDIPGVGARLAKMPTYFIVGREDPQYLDTKRFYDAVVNAGSQQVNIDIYSDAQMKARRIARAHDVEIIALEQSKYAQWMFSQTL